MTIIDAAILGIVEGVSEFLPISSTGHLMIASKLLGLPTTEFLKSFEIAIQLGAILSVIVLYYKNLILNKETIKRVAIAFLPTAVIGLLLYKIIKHYLLEDTRIVLCALFVGGIALILFELLHREKKDASSCANAITYRQAFLIGVAQSFAVIPGVSRAAATIIGGLLVGVNRQAIVEFSFLLAVPTMAAATALDLLKSAPSFTVNEFGLLSIGFITSFCVAIIAIRSFLAFIAKHNFISFGVYRIVIALTFWILWR